MQLREQGLRLVLAQAASFGPPLLLDFLPGLPLDSRVAGYLPPSPLGHLFQPEQAS